MKIGTLASRADLPAATIRYYEKRGLIPEPPRSNSGYRRYSADAVDRLRFIKRAQALGFALDEIGELLELRVEHGKACEPVEARAREKLSAVRSKIQELRQMEKALKGLTAACRSRTPTGDCPILEALSEGESGA